MQTIALTAHFDGQQIILDEPFELEPNAALLVTVLPQPAGAIDEAWAQLALQNMALAYGQDEPEYTSSDLKSLNPTYAGG